MARHLDWYNREFQQQLSKADIAGSKIYDRVQPAHLAQVRAYPDNPDFFVDIPIYPQARAVIEELQQHFDIIIATAAMEHPNSFAPKYQWLIKHLPSLSPLDFVFCGNKGLLKADYLIDDSPRHFINFSGQGVLFSAPHNLHATATVRVNDWQEVHDYFLKV
jgi:5'-nucleotidase